MLDPYDPEHGGEWRGRVESAERVSRFAEEATRRLKRAFDEHDSRRLEEAVEFLRDLYASSERALAVQAAATASAERRARQTLLVAVLGVAVGVVGAVVGLIT